MSNYQSRHTGEAIDDAVSAVQSGNIGGGGDFNIRIVKKGSTIPDDIDLDKTFLVLEEGRTYYPCISVVNSIYTFGLMRDGIFRTHLYENGNWTNEKGDSYLQRIELTSAPSTNDKGAPGKLVYNSAEQACYFHAGTNGNENTWVRFYGSNDNVALLYRADFSIDSSAWVAAGSEYSYTMRASSIGVANGGVDPRLSTLRTNSLILINHSETNVGITAEASNESITFHSPKKVADSVQMGWFNDS